MARLSGVGEVHQTEPDGEVDETGAVARRLFAGERATLQALQRVDGLFDAGATVAAGVCKTSGCGDLPLERRDSLADVGGGSVRVAVIAMRRDRRAERGVMVPMQHDGKDRRVGPFAVVSPEGDWMTADVDRRLDFP
jgi:hypothetical protein